MFKNSELDTNKFFPEVIQVVPSNNYEIFIYFNDGSIHLFDMKNLIKEGTVFEALKNIETFKNALCIKNSTAAWNLDNIGIVDIDPFVLFDSERIDEEVVLKNM
jgi:hypothetical protein